MEGWKVKELRALWWHETLRAIGSIPGLPLVVLRTALVYGEGFGRFEGKLCDVPAHSLSLWANIRLMGLAAALIHLGLVYKHLNREMKLLWSPELPKSSITTYDISCLVWKAAE